MFNNKEGQAVPNVTFIYQTNEEWQTRTSDDIFKDRTVVVFSLPGAFTPTCSSTHLPGYNELAAVFKENGVDEIVCLSVNDTFVMNAWAENQAAENITLIPDGNGDFTKAMGLLVDKSELGFGHRSWRYSMLVKNGMIEKMFIEPNKPGDPFEVSDAETLLHYINPKAVAERDILMVTKPGCPYCAKAKSMLADRGLGFEELSLNTDVSIVGLRAMSGATSVPQVYIDGALIGGSDDLADYLASH